MKSNRSSLASLSLITALIILSLTPTEAFCGEGKVRSLIKNFKQVNKSQQRLQRKFDALSDADQAEVLGSLPGITFGDSDEDGLPDLLEDDENGLACDPDSDADGILDGDQPFVDSEFPEGVPGDDSSQEPDEIGDQEPGGGANLSGVIISFGDQEFTVSGEIEGQLIQRVYTVNDVTRFTSCGLTRRDKCDLSHFRSGDEVRVLAYYNGGLYRAYAVFGSVPDGTRR